MKYFVIISALLIIAGCSSVPEEAYYGYEPEYEGRFVNSVEKIQGWYALNTNTFSKADLLHPAPFYGGYHLGTVNNYFSATINKLSILVFPDTNTILKKLGYRHIIDRESRYTPGMRVIILNTTSDTVDLDIQDGSVKMIQEALNPNGVWIPIEYWLNSSCGISYGSAYLYPNHYLETNAFRYTGTYKTKLRFKLLYSTKYIPETKQRIMNYIYSEPFDGSVNYSQLGKPKPDMFRDYFE